MLGRLKAFFKAPSAFDVYCSSIKAPRGVDVRMAVSPYMTSAPIPHKSAGSATLSINKELWRVQQRRTSNIARNWHAAEREAAAKNPSINGPSPAHLDFEQAAFRQLRTREVIKTQKVALPATLVLYGFAILGLMLLFPEDSASPILALLPESIKAKHFPHLLNRDDRPEKSMQLRERQKAIADADFAYRELVNSEKRDF